jgi:hypothetical protein
MALFPRRYELRPQKEHSMKHIGFTAAAVIALLISSPAWAGDHECQIVGGVLMTNIGVINDATPDGTNLGAVFGDLAGSVAATIKGQDNKGNFLVQHYWVTSSGETIVLKEAVLTPVATNDPNVVAVLWGNYSSDILGGTGKFKNATGRIDYFGIADFKELTLVLRYKAKVCH